LGCEKNNFKGTPLAWSDVFSVTTVTGKLPLGNAALFASRKDKEVFNEKVSVGHDRASCM
jgi:hypothetical protein